MNKVKETIKENMDRMIGVIEQVISELKTDITYPLLGDNTLKPAKYYIHRQGVYFDDGPTIDFHNMSYSISSFSILLRIIRLIDMNILDILAYDSLTALEQNSPTEQVMFVCEHVQTKIEHFKTQKYC